MQSTTNFRPVFLKKVVSHFSRNPWPRICKKSQKISNFWKKNFSLETTLNALKFVRNTICAVHDKFQAGISQKRSWSFFKKSVTPGMQKKSKNFQFSKKKFFAQNNLKYLKICSHYHLCSLRQISGRYLSKKKLVIFQEICDPRYAKKVTKIANFRDLSKNLKRLKIFSQHHLCSPRQISGRYLSKKKLVIFQEICDPGHAKKVKKSGIFKKKFFARNNLKRLKIRSLHHLCSPPHISGRYLSKKKLVIFQQICDPGYAKKVKKFPIFEKNFFRSKQP